LCALIAGKLRASLFVVSLGDWCPRFRDSLLVSSSRDEKHVEEEIIRLFDHRR
jgi:hypothetical protein